MRPPSKSNTLLVLLALSSLHIVTCASDKSWRIAEVNSGRLPVETRPLHRAKTPPQWCAQVVVRDGKIAWTDHAVGREYQSDFNASKNDFSVCAYHISHGVCIARWKRFFPLLVDAEGNVRYYLYMMQSWTTLSSAPTNPRYRMAVREFGVSFNSREEGKPVVLDLLESSPGKIDPGGTLAMFTARCENGTMETASPAPFYLETHNWGLRQTITRVRFDQDLVIAAPEGRSCKPLLTIRKGSYLNIYDPMADGVPELAFSSGLFTHLNDDGFCRKDPALCFSLLEEQGAVAWEIQKARPSVPRSGTSPQPPADSGLSPETAAPTPSPR